MNHRLTAKLLGLAILIAIVGGGVYWQWTATGPEPSVGSSPAEAAPPITWTPSALNQVIGQGQTKTVTVSFMASEKLMDVVVRVVPELQPFVQVSPSSFSTITKGQTITLNITIAASSTAPVGTATGTIQLRSGGKPPKTFAKPLPATVEVWQRVVERTSDISFAIPPDVITYQGEDSLTIGDATHPTTAPLFVAFMIDVPPEIALLPPNEALERIARSQLGEDFVTIAAFRDGGAEVLTSALITHHFFVYSAGTQKAIDFAEVREGFLSSQEFLLILESLMF